MSNIDDGTPLIQFDNHYYDPNTILGQNPGFVEYYPHAVGLNFDFEESFQNPSLSEFEQHASRWITENIGLMDVAIKSSHLVGANSVHPNEDYIHIFFFKELDHAALFMLKFA